jgi:hypothetical protein
MGNVAVIGSSSSGYSDVVFSRRSLGGVLRSIATDVEPEVIDDIVERGNYEVTIVSRKVDLSGWMLRTS